MVAGIIVGMLDLLEYYSAVTSLLGLIIPKHVQTGSMYRVCLSLLRKAVKIVYVNFCFIGIQVKLVTRVQVKFMTRVHLPSLFSREY